MKKRLMNLLADNPFIVSLYRRLWLPHVLKRKVKEAEKLKIIVGANWDRFPGWIRTQQEYFNMLKPSHWRRFFQPDSIDTILAEHVWEHLTETDGVRAAKFCFQYLKPNAYIRVAVPDGLHPDPEYINWVKIGGCGPESDDHKVLYTYKTLKEIFEKAGFRVKLYEYFDESGVFHYEEWNPEDGMIKRSKRFDQRNQQGKLNYTSIVMDAIKP